jgi:GT2 family glycosyltransferase
MSLTLCIPTIRRFDTLKTCVDSALSYEIRPDKILIMDNSAGGQLNHHLFDNQPVWIHTPDYNWGCAKSWNWFMQQNEDVIIIANDDVTFNERTIASCVEAYKEESFRFISPCAGANIFSCFLLPKSVYEQVGPFDEQFWPAYFEDNDYSLRVTNAGITFYFTGAGYSHVGSATIAAYSHAELQAHQQQFAANQQRFYNKWGRLP